MCPTGPGSALFGTGCTQIGRYDHTPPGADRSRNQRNRPYAGETTRIGCLLRFQCPHIIHRSTAVPSPDPSGFGRRCATAMPSAITRMSLLVQRVQNYVAMGGYRGQYANKYVPWVMWGRRNDSRMCCVLYRAGYGTFRHRIHPNLHFFCRALSARTTRIPSLRQEVRGGGANSQRTSVTGIAWHPEHAKNMSICGVMAVWASISDDFFGIKPAISTLNGTPHPYTGAYHGNFRCPGPVRLWDTHWERLGIRVALQPMLVTGRSWSWGWCHIGEIHHKRGVYGCCTRLRLCYYVPLANTRQIQLN